VRCKHIGHSLSLDACVVYYSEMLILIW